MVSLQQVINSALSLRLVSAFAQGLPPRLGHRIGDYAAEQIARQGNSELVRAMRANQWVIHGECLDGDELDQVMRATFRYAARWIFDLYHYIGNPTATGELIVLSPSFQELAQRPEFDRHGLMIVGLHLSNFDLVLQWLCGEGLKPLVLTLPDPQGARRMEYERRRKAGMNLVPASFPALRQALHHLQRGGLVVTGIDRPLPTSRVRPRFFGRPAALPMHHIFLATKARIPLVIAVTNLEQDGKYHVYASDRIEMDAHPDPDLEALRNAEKVLSVAEEFIRRVPQQWAVPLPVWPEVLDFVPE
jgi:KDO2-lipid IV(A) lauroyltransferase